MKPSIQRIISFIITAAVAGTVLAALPPPETPFEDHSWKAVSNSKPTTGLKMGAFIVQFEKTTLAMVRKAVGRGEIAHQGDAGASIYWLCYTAHSKKQTERIWIVAHGEMGGSEHAVTRISSETVGTNESEEGCPVLPGSLSPVSFDNGLWLGAQKERALKILGRPSSQKDSWWVFDYVSKVPGKCEPDGFDILNWFEFEIRNGQLDRIHSGQVTSC